VKTTDPAAHDDRDLEEGVRVNAPSGQPDPVTSIDWVHRADALQAPWGMFVDGEQRPAISGSGRDKSRHAMDEYTDLKTTWINYG